MAKHESQDTAKAGGQHRQGQHEKGTPVKNILGRIRNENSRPTETGPTLE